MVVSERIRILVGQRPNAVNPRLSLPFVRLPPRRSRDLRVAHNFGIAANPIRGLRTTFSCSKEQQTDTRILQEIIIIIIMVRFWTTVVTWTLAMGSSCTIMAHNQEETMGLRGNAHAAAVATETNDNSFVRFLLEDWFGSHNNNNDNDEKTSRAMTEHGTRDLKKVPVVKKKKPDGGIGDLLKDKPTGIKPGSSTIPDQPGRALRANSDVELEKKKPKKPNRGLVMTSSILPRKMREMTIPGSTVVVSSNNDQPDRALLRASDGDMERNTKQGTSTMPHRGGRQLEKKPLTMKMTMTIKPGK